MEFPPLRVALASGHLLLPGLEPSREGLPVAEVVRPWGPRTERLLGHWLADLWDMCTTESLGQVLNQHLGPHLHLNLLQQLLRKAKVSRCLRHLQ